MQTELLQPCPMGGQAQLSKDTCCPGAALEGGSRGFLGQAHPHSLVFQTQRLFPPQGLGNAKPFSWVTVAISGGWRELWRGDWPSQRALHGPCSARDLSYGVYSEFSTRLCWSLLLLSFSLLSLSQADGTKNLFFLFWDRLLDSPMIADTEGCKLLPAFRDL